jgi:predicted nucleic acid-binding protein
MKVAITDANIFIDLINIKLIVPFFELKLEIHTSLDVLGELHDHQSAILSAFQSAKKLTVHNLSADQIDAMHVFIPSKRLSDADKTVIFIAREENAMLLSSDGPARKFAKDKNIETHGLVWLFDELVKNNIINQKHACHKINELLTSNTRYKDDQRMLEEFNYRLQQWKE